MLGRDVRNRFFISDLVRNEFASVWLKKTRFGSDTTSVTTCVIAK